MRSMQARLAVYMSFRHISYQLLKSERDANHIVHFSEWSSLERARRFFESPERVKIRKQAGVKTPNFLYLQALKKAC